MKAFVLAAALAAGSFPSIAAAAAPSSPQPRHEADPFKLTVVASRLEHPWGLALLPDGRFLVTEREGRMRLVAKDGSLSEPLAGIPKVYARGQGGLLDVTLSPQFATDKLVANAHALVDSVVKAKPAAAKGKYLKSVTVSSTMGPGVRIDTTAVDAASH